MIRGRAGIVLAMVLGLLMMLVLTGLVLVQFAGAHRSGTALAVLSARAGLLARSGVEHASSRLCRDIRVPFPAARGNQSRDWTFRDGDIPLARAHNPSYAAGEPYLDGGGLDGRYEEGAGSPDGFDAATQDLDGDGRHTGFTGRLRGTLVPYGDRYALRIEDENAKIDINGGLLDARDRDGDGTPDHRDTDAGGWNGALVRIGDILGGQPGIGVPGLGTAAVSQRPAGGWPSVRAFQAAVGTPVDLSLWISTNAWDDRDVIRPNRTAASETGAPNVQPAELKKRRGAPRAEEGGRPPVNLNAARRPVLVALLSGLSGVSYPNRRGVLAHTIPPAMAEAIADEIVARRASAPFSSWGDFGAFCDALVPGTIQGMLTGFRNDGGNLCGADLLKANFDPNARLNKELPDRILWRWIDKSDLSVGSTEGTFDPAGVLSVESIGTVADGRGGAQAQAPARAVLRTLALLRQTTQAQFVAGRSIADAPRYLTAATAGPPTAGATLGWGGAAGTGLGALTYPCAIPALPAKAADYDGWIGLASIEEPHIPPPEGGTVLFLHHFDDSWDAAIGAPPGRIPDPIAPASDTELQTDVTEAVWPSSPGLRPSTLQPDGAFIQWLRNPAFHANGNLPPASLNAMGTMGNRGALSFWVKVDGTGCRDTGIGFFVCNREDANDYSEIAAIGRWFDRFGTIAELRPMPGGNDPRTERQYQANHESGNAAALLPDARWQLVTSCFDTKVADTGRDVLMRIGGIRGPGNLDPIYLYPQVYDMTLSEDLLTPGLPMYLGGARSCQSGHITGGDHVVDEFASADLGDDVDVARFRASRWHDERYAAGRYYKGNDARFLSAPMDSPGGVPARLVLARWTEALPSEVRQDIRVTTSRDNPPAQGETRPRDPNLAESRIDLEILDESGTAVLSPLAQGGAVDSPLPSRFRWRATFLPTAGAVWSTPNFLENNPVLESPFLDDVTLYLREPRGSAVLAWE